MGVLRNILMHPLIYFFIIYIFVGELLSSLARYYGRAEGLIYSHTVRIYSAFHDFVILV